MKLLLVVLILVHADGAKLRAHNGTAHVVLRSNITHAVAQRNLVHPSFQGWYGEYSSGWGIWKWSNALTAYQHHISHYANTAVSVLEVGVQSGGSIHMWHSVLGLYCTYYGVDINEQCMKFAGPQAVIFVGDQGIPNHWTHFFTHVTQTVDVAIDDGGHQANQMLTTLTHVFPHLKAGGLHCIEDIHAQNDNYLQNMFYPAADFLAANEAEVASVHIYPFLLVTQKVPEAAAAPQASMYVQTTEELMSAIQQPENRGKVIGLANPAWGSFHAAQALKNFFGMFYELHAGTIVQSPPACHNLGHGACVMQVVNCPLQNLVSGVHVYPGFAQVEVAVSPPVINAVRKGDQWIPYR